MFLSRDLLLVKTQLLGYYVTQGRTKLLTSGLEIPISSLSSLLLCIIDHTHIDHTWILEYLLHKHVLILIFFGICFLLPMHTIFWCGVKWFSICFLELNCLLHLVHGVTSCLWTSFICLFRALAIGHYTQRIGCCKFLENAKSIDFVLIDHCIIPTDLQPNGKPAKNNNLVFTISPC